MVAEIVIGEKIGHVSTLQDSACHRKAFKFTQRSLLLKDFRPITDDILLE